MVADPRDAAYLVDMLEAAGKVRRYVRDKTFKGYQRDDLLRDAVERNVDIIGEAARKVSEAFKRSHPEIPWRKIIALRNVLAHEYGHVDNKDMWEVAALHIPDLIGGLESLIPPLPPEVEE